MNYTIEVSCPKCGGELVHENATTRDAGYSALAIARCPRRTCPAWELRVELITCGVAEVPA